MPVRNWSVDVRVGCWKLRRGVQARNVNIGRRQNAAQWRWLLRPAARRGLAAERTRLGREARRGYQHPGSEREGRVGRCRSFLPLVTPSSRLLSSPSVLVAAPPTSGSDDAPPGRALLVPVAHMIHLSALFLLAASSDSAHLLNGFDTFGTV